MNLRSVLNKHPGAIFYYLSLLLVCVLYSSRDLFSTSDALGPAVLIGFLSLLGITLWVSFGRSNTLYRITMAPLLMFSLAMPLALIFMQSEPDMRFIKRLDIENYPGVLLNFVATLVILTASLAIHGIVSREKIVKNHPLHSRNTNWSRGLLAASLVGLLLLLTYTYHELIPLNDTWVRHILEPSAVTESNSSTWLDKPETEHATKPYGLLLLFPLVQTLVFIPWFYRAIFQKHRQETTVTNDTSVHHEHWFNRLGLFILSAAIISLTSYALRNHFTFPERGFADDIIEMISGAAVGMVYLQVGIALFQGRLRQWFQQTRVRRGIFYCACLPFLPLALFLFLISPTRKRAKGQLDSPWLQVAFVLLIIVTVAFTLPYSTTTRLLSANLAFTKISSDSRHTNYYFSYWDVSEERLIEALKATDFWGTPLKHSLNSVFLTFSKYSPNVLNCLEERHGIHELQLNFAKTSKINILAIKLETVDTLHCLHANASIQIGDLSQMKNLQEISFRIWDHLDLGQLKLYQLPFLDTLVISDTLAITGKLVPDHEVNKNKLSRISIRRRFSWQASDLDLQQISLAKLSKLKFLSLMGPLSGHLSILRDSPLRNLTLSSQGDPERNHALITSIPPGSAVESISLYNCNLLHDSLLHLAKLENLKELSLERVQLGDFSFLEQLPPGTIVHLNSSDTLMTFLDNCHDLSIRIPRYSWDWYEMRGKEAIASNRLARILINNPGLELGDWKLANLASQAISRGVNLDDWELTEGQRQKLLDAIEESQQSYPETDPRNPYHPDYIGPPDMQTSPPS
jgi:hypothetical protein